VHHVVTDLAVLDIAPSGFVLKELAPGYTFEDVQKLTEAKLTPAPDLRTVKLN
jgi:3-oxoacid CoA-transferase subunit B